MLAAALDGKRALLTNSGNGLGFLMAVACAQAGATVLLHDRSAAVGAAAADRLLLAVPGSEVRWIEADLSTAQGADVLIAQAGALDFLLIDGLAAAAVEFSTVDEQQSQYKQSDTITESRRLLDAFNKRSSEAQAAKVFQLSLATTLVNESSIERKSHSVTRGQGAFEVYEVTVSDMLLAPVADLVRSEVMRTNDSIAAVSQRLLEDHRPGPIQAALHSLRQLTDGIIRICIGAA